MRRLYTLGDSPFQRGALAHRRRIDLGEEPIWVAPPEYVIVRKLELFREEQRGKHLTDIRGMLAVSGDEVDLEHVQNEVACRRLEAEWRRVHEQAA